MRVGWVLSALYECAVGMGRCAIDRCVCRWA